MASRAVTLQNRPPHAARSQQWMWMFGVFALAFFVPVFSALYMNFLRSKFARELPSEWAQVTNNGSFAVASPFIISTKSMEEGRYAIKVMQAYHYGFPYDPYTGDRSLRSWIFDSLSFYPLVPFVAIAGGNIHWAWVLANGFFSVLWILSFYAVFRRYGIDRIHGLCCAVLLFFFIDVFLKLLNFPFVPTRDKPHHFFLFLAYAFGQVQWMRLPTPGMTALFSFWSLAAGYLLAIAPNRKTFAALAAGAASGLLCFSHPYEWMIAVGSLATFFILAVFLKLPSAGRHNLGCAAIIAAIVSLAYYLFSRSLTYDLMPDIIERVGSIRKFEWPIFAHLLWCLLFLRIASEESGERRWLWTLWSSVQAVATGSYLLPWVLGYDLQFSHIASLSDVAILLALFCWTLDHWGRENRIWAHAPLAIMMVFCQVYFREKAWADTHYKLFGTPQHVEQALHWVNARLPGHPLFVSLSIVATQELALNTQARSLVADGSPSYGSPVSTEQILRGLAKTLKTSKADPELFFRQRWYDFDANDLLNQQTAYFTRNVCLPCIENAKWPEFLINIGAFKHDVRMRSAQNVLRYYEEETQVSDPYYFWLGQDDLPLLKKMPESYGGKLIYENPSVRIYVFNAPGLRGP